MTLECFPLSIKLIHSEREIKEHTSSILVSQHQNRNTIRFSSDTLLDPEALNPNTHHNQTLNQVARQDSPVGAGAWWQGLPPHPLLWRFRVPHGRPWPRYQILGHAPNPKAELSMPAWSAGQRQHQNPKLDLFFCPCHQPYSPFAPNPPNSFLKSGHAPSCTTQKRQRKPKRRRESCRCFPRSSSLPSPSSTSFISSLPVQTKSRRGCAERAAKHPKLRGPSTQTLSRDSSALR